MNEYETYLVSLLAEVAALELAVVVVTAASDATTLELKLLTDVLIIVSLTAFEATLFVFGLETFLKFE